MKHIETKTEKAQVPSNAQADKPMDKPTEEPDRGRIVGEVVEILKGSEPGFISGLLVSLKSRERSGTEETMADKANQDQAEDGGEGESLIIKKLRERYKAEAMDKALKAVSGYVASEQREILESALGEVQKVLDSASRLIALRDRVCRIYDGLDVKSKAAITTLQELAAVEGCSVGVDYGHELLYVTGRDKGSVDLAQTELPDDPDVKTLAEVYELSSFVNQAV